MAVEKIVNVKVNDDFAKTDNAVKSLRTQLREAQQEVAAMADKFGATSAEAVQAAKRAAELKDRIGDAKDLTDAFSPDEKFKALSGALQGVAGGFAVYQGALGAAGVENKELEKQILKVQSAMSMVQGLNAIGASIDSYKNLGTKLKETAAAQAILSAATSVQTFVTGAATTAMKAFRVALIGTGIGALVVGVGLLIANFEKISNWVSNLIEKFGGWRNVLMVVATPIWAIVKALEAMGAIETEAEEKSRKAAEAKAARNKKEASELEKRKTQIGDYYDFEIAKAEASGKDTFELEKKKRDAIIATARAINERMRATIQDGTATEAEIKRWNENQALITKLQNENVTSELKREKEKNDKLAEQQKEANQKAKERREKRAAEEKEAREKEKQEILEFQRAIFQAQKDTFDAQVNAQVEKDNLLKSLQKKSREEELFEEYQKNQAILDAAKASQADYITLQTDYLDKLQAITDEKNAEAEAKNKERKEQELAITQAVAEAKQAIEEKSFEIAERGISLLKTVFEKNKAIQKALIVAESAMGIAKIIINTRAANSAVRLRNAALPPPLGPSLTATEIALNNVSAGLGIAANIAATSKALSALGGGGGGGGGGDTGGSAPAAPQFNIVGQNPNNQLAATIAGQQGQPIRAYVVGQEVTTQQSLDRQIRNTATFNS
jgi:hypothetical protein